MGTMVLTAHLDAAEDAYIASQSPTGNTGDSTSLQVGNSFLIGSNLTARAVLRFNLGRLDPKAVIAAAALTLYGSAVIASSPGTFYCRRLTTTTWTEAGVTWNTVDGSTSWTASGGDYTTTDQSTASVSNGATSVTFTGLKAMIDTVRAAGGSWLNLIIMGPETTGASNYFQASSCDAGTVNEPALIVVDDTDQDLVDAVSKTVDDALRTSTTTALYSTKDHTTPTYVRHTGCWANITGADLTPISVWNSVDPDKYGCVLLHNRIGLVADHVWGDGAGNPASGTIGATFRFVASNGSVVTGTVDDYERVAHDIGLVRFASTVSGIGIANVLPANYFSYLRNMRAGDSLPVGVCPAMFTDQEEKALITMFYGENDDVSNDNTSTMSPTNVSNYASSIPRPSLGIASRYVDYFENPVSGDSSNPGASLLIDGKFVVTCSLLGDPAAGTSLTYHLTEINSTMNSLVSGAAVTQIDLSSYRVYPKRSVLGPLVYARCSHV